MLNIYGPQVLVQAPVRGDVTNGLFFYPNRPVGHDPLFAAGLLIVEKKKMR